MSNDTFIDTLSADLAPVKPMRPYMFMARVAMLAAAIALTIIGSIGLRPDLGVAFPSVAKPAYFLVLGVVIAMGLFFSALPARGRAHWRYGSYAIIAGGFLLLVAEIAGSGMAAINDAMARPNSLACLLSIGLFGLVPFYWLMRWLKSAAPSSPVSAGMAAGALSGSLAAAAYGLHCDQDAVAYIGLWYVTPILVHVALGAMIGRNYLRW